MIVFAGTPKFFVGRRPVVPVECGCHEALPLLGGGVEAGNVVTSFVAFVVSSLGLFKANGGALWRQEALKYSSPSL